VCIRRSPPLTAQTPAGTTTTTKVTAPSPKRAKKRLQGMHSLGGTRQRSTYRYIDDETSDGVRLQIGLNNVAKRLGVYTP
jgi:hypothetical protein